jgi:hypothetical protein
MQPSVSRHCSPSLPLAADFRHEESSLCWALASFAEADSAASRHLAWEASGACARAAGEAPSTTREHEIHTVHRSLETCIRA